MRSAARPKCSKIKWLDEALYSADQTNWRFRFGLAFVTITAKGKYNPKRRLDTDRRKENLRSNELE